MSRGTIRYLADEDSFTETWRDTPKPVRKPSFLRLKFHDWSNSAEITGLIEQARSWVQRNMREWPYGYVLDYRFERDEMCFYWRKDEE